MFLTSSSDLGEEPKIHNPILWCIAALKSPIDKSTNDIIGAISTAAIELSQSEFSLYWS